MKLRLMTLLALGLATACQPARDVSFSIQLPGDTSDNAEGVAVSIHTEPNCAGDPVYASFISLQNGAGMASSMPSVLAPGVYYIQVEARDAGCSVLAEGCEPVTLPIEGDALVITAANASGEACPAGQCMNGRCEGDVPPDAGPGPVDAGVDAGPQPCMGNGECPGGTCEGGECCFGCWDGTACQAGNTPAACGSEGGACSACGGTQRCNAGTCMDIPGDVDSDLSLGIDTTFVTVNNGVIYSAGAQGANLPHGNLVSSTPNVFAQQDTDLRFAHVAAMQTTTCGITIAGEMYCWGSNVAGLRGSGESDPAPVADPERVNIDTWKDVEAGREHFCAIRDDDHLLCWGNNGAGQLGFEGGGARFSPTDVDPTATWRSVSCGDTHTCAIRMTGELYCWGTGDDGRLGQTGPTATDIQPTRVGSGSDWQYVSAGAEHTCGIRSGDLFCWGDQTQNRLGTGMDSGIVETPALVDDSETWVSVAAGQFHTCGLLDSGEARCWGFSRNGETGLGVTGQTATPTRVASGFSQIEVNWEHSCGLRTDTSGGALFCWGQGTNGAIGSGANDSESSPVPAMFVPAL